MGANGGHMLSTADQLTFKKRLPYSSTLDVTVKYTICIDKGDEEATIEDIEAHAENSLTRGRDVYPSLNDETQEEIGKYAQELVNTEFEKKQRWLK